MLFLDRRNSSAGGRRWNVGIAFFETLRVSGFKGLLFTPAALSIPVAIVLTQDTVSTATTVLLLVSLTLCLVFMSATAYTDPGVVPPGTHWFDHVRDNCIRTEEGVMFKLMHPSSSFVARATDGTGAFTRQGTVYYDAEDILPPADIAGSDPHWVTFSHSAIAKYRMRKRPTDMIELRGTMQNMNVVFKWCCICEQLRHPRTRHCVTCDMCVDRFDHHCVWISSCIGLRNYRYFIGFVFSTIFELTITLYVNSVTIYRIYKSKGGGSNGGLSTLIDNQQFTCNAIGWILSAVFWAPLVQLGLFHVILIVTEKTTTEETRDIYPNGSPFNEGFVNNVRRLICSRAPAQMRSLSLPLYKPGLLDL